MKNQGFVLSFTIVLFVIISILVFAMSFEIFASKKIVKTYEDNFYEIETMNKTIEEMVKNFQSIKNDLNDNDKGINYLNFITKYQNQIVSIEDISSKLNKSFINESFITSNSLLKFADSPDYQTEYSWINLNYCSSSQLYDVKKSLTKNNTIDLFPLVNVFPLFNIYKLDQQFLSALLEAHGFDDASGKAFILKEKSLSSTFNKKEMAHVLNVQESNLVFSLIGTKTAFWKICIKSDNLSAQFIIAGIPNKKNQCEIEKYVVVSKKIYNKKGEIL